MNFKLLIFLFLAVAISTKKEKRNRQSKREDRELKKQIGIERNIASVELENKRTFETKISFKIKQTLKNFKSNPGKLIFSHFGFIKGERSNWSQNQCI